LPTWGELAKELGELREALARNPPPGEPILACDLLRRRYLERLSTKTGRAVIVYYSAWLTAPAAPPDALSVGLGDIAGFMEACSNAGARELDLLIHSPGGDPDAAEQICAYLRTQFDHIRAIVPVAAMSAATMIALSADEIVMGTHSQLGPIDPQLTIHTPEGPRRASAQAIKDQFEMALKQCKDPSNLPAWMPILRTLAPGLLASCDYAAKRAEEIVAKALELNMFRNFDDPAASAAATAAWFGNAEEFLSHGRPVRRDQAREHDVLVVDLEDDSEFQDLVLSVHHAIMHSFGATLMVKLVENHHGRSWLATIGLNAQLVLPGAEPQQPAPGALFVD
jgi:hypothetical protein